ncbi:hypothetical protein [Clostridium sp. ZBS12]|uniref:hypothetical protein n=1 Tax=Clostridium sp. ZBS12 TaxID=2949972 RepID=UPI00207AAE48|nr:hypothetical protein [Clostridium sp. ZBS12]
MIKIKKINDTRSNLMVQGQGCEDDCVEYNVWVGKTNGNKKGCVLYDETNTPKTTTWW